MFSTKKEETAYMEIVIVVIFPDSRILHKIGLFHIPWIRNMYLACLQAIFGLELTNDLIKWTAILIDAAEQNFYSDILNFDMEVDLWRRSNWCDSPQTG